jgi:beta-glucosidase
MIVNEEKIQSLIAQMTLEEKVALLAGADLWHTVPIERLGIPVMKVTDGPNGARGAEGNSAPTSACFPAGVALAATWNPALVEKIGQALAQEVAAKGAHMLLAPTVNIHRTPLAGRNFECYSEDPYLASRMAVAYINGLQSQGVGACIKHFVCNDQEFERNSISSEVSERALHELYLVPFQTAMREAKPWAVMSSYNKLNGTYCSENSSLLLDILKKEWGFDGLLMSDWNGTYSSNAAAGGMDLEMPGPARWMGKSVIEDVHSGKLTEEFIDDKVRRVLRTLYRVGVFESPNLKPEQSIDRPEHRALIRQAGSEAIVLLKNNGILPVEMSKVQSIAVIGALAAKPTLFGGGSASVTPHYSVSPLAAIRQCAQAHPQLKVEYTLGTPIDRRTPSLDMSCVQSPDGLPGRLAIEYFATSDFSGSPLAYQIADRSQIEWSDNFLKSANPQQFSARLTGKFIAPETGRYTFSLFGNGSSRLLLDGRVIVDRWSDRQVGDSDPWSSGESLGAIDLQQGQEIQLTIEHTWQGSNPWRFTHIGCLPPQPADPISTAESLARSCDVAIVFAGLTSEWESEGFDRADMDLPAEQNELIARVAAANPNTIVVLSCGAPLNMPWLDRVAGVFHAWYLGQETGNAMADVIFGEVNPSGKLPTTFPKRLQDNPAFINYPGENGRVHYGEGLFVGYRYYDKKEIEPLFPFGYGLSYTTFVYRNLTLNANQFGTGDEIKITLEVENSGKRAGAEIVQCYVRDIESRLVRPEKELKAFVRVFLQPGEGKQVSLTLNRDSLAYYDDKTKAWVADPGDFEILIGSSSRDIRLRAQFNWTADSAHTAGALKGKLSTASKIKDLLDNPASRAILERHLPEMLHAPELGLALEMSLEAIAPFVPQILTAEKLAQINEELKGI